MLSKIYWHFAQGVISFSRKCQSIFFSFSTHLPPEQVSGNSSLGKEGVTRYNPLLTRESILLLRVRVSIVAIFLQFFDG